MRQGSALTGLEPRTGAFVCFSTLTTTPCDTLVMFSVFLKLKDELSLSLLADF